MYLRKNKQNERAKQPTNDMLFSPLTESIHQRSINLEMYKNKNTKKDTGNIFVYRMPYCIVYSLIHILVTNARNKVWKMS